MAEFLAAAPGALATLGGTGTAAGAPSAGDLAGLLGKLGFGGQTPDQTQNQALDQFINNLNPSNSTLNKSFINLLECLNNLKILIKINNFENVNNY